MRIVLVGADFEENLGVGMIAAVARNLGHTVRIVTYDRPDQRVAVARAVMSKRPQVVGLSMQFQHRAHDFLALARTLRASGSRRARSTMGMSLSGPHPMRVFTVTGSETRDTTILAISTIARGSRSQPAPAPRRAILGTQQPQLTSM